MTSANLLARVRTFLDEASAGNYTDAEIYSALTDGQYYLANYGVSVFRSTGKVLGFLQTLLETTASTTTGAISKPSDYWELITAKFSTDSTTKYRCKSLSVEEAEDVVNNSYFSPAKQTPAIYDDGQLNFLPTPAVEGTYTLTYLEKVTDIDGSTNPVLHESCHNLLPVYAFSQLLLKEDRTQESQAEMAKFENMVKVL